MADKSLIGGNGAEGSNSHRVFVDHFNLDDAEYHNAVTFSALFDGLLNDKYAKIVVPTHNALVGDVSEVKQILSDLKTKGIELDREGEEIGQLLEHALISGPAASLDTVKVAISYTAALEQCQKTITNLGLETRYHDDTYGAAVDVIAKNDPAEAAIAPIGAANDLNGIVLVDNMSDIVPNITFFSIFVLNQG